MKSIAEVETETGVPRATIRIWERRYGFPEPARDERGERRYPPTQVEQLRRMARLIEQGYRPAALLEGGAAGIDRLWDGLRTRAGAPPPAREAAALLRLLKRHDAPAVKRELAAQLDRVGLAVFVCEVAHDINTAIGDAWMSGELEVHEEHLYCDCLYEVVRPAIAKLEATVRPEAPTVMLTTLSHESHGLGLLSAQAMFALQGCPTIALGLQLPPEQIAAAARAYRAELVGLSVSSAAPAAQVLRSLEELRGLLPGAVRLWAGGNAPVLKKRRVAGVRSVGDAAAIPDLLAEDFALPPLGRGDLS